MRRVTLYKCDAFTFSFRSAIVPHCLWREPLFFFDTNILRHSIVTYRLLENVFSMCCGLSVVCLRNSSCAFIYACSCDVTGRILMTWRHLPNWFRLIPCLIHRKPVRILNIVIWWILRNTACLWTVLIPSCCIVLIYLYFAVMHVKYVYYFLSWRSLIFLLKLF